MHGFDRRNRKNLHIFAILTLCILVYGVVYIFSSNEEVNEKNGEGIVEVAKFMETKSDSSEAEKELDGPIKHTDQEVISDDKKAKLKMFLKDKHPKLGFVEKLRNDADNFIAPKMTADAFYDEKLKQKEEEDKRAVIENEEFYRPTNKTQSRNMEIVEKSESVQRWLNRQENAIGKKLSDIESQLKSLEPNPNLRNAGSKDLNKSSNQLSMHFLQ